MCVISGFSFFSIFKNVKWASQIDQTTVVAMKWQQEKDQKAAPAEIYIGRQATVQYIVQRKLLSIRQRQEKYFCPFGIPVQNIAATAAPTTATVSW